MTHTIRALANPRNLFHCTVYKPFEQLSGERFERTELTDNSTFVMETVEFPDGSQREIRLSNGDHYRCNVPGGQWTCIGGANFGQKFDAIQVWNEEGKADGEWAGCLFVNVIAYKVVHHTVSW